MLALPYRLQALPQRMSARAAENTLIGDVEATGCAVDARLRQDQSAKLEHFASFDQAFSAGQHGLTRLPLPTVFRQIACGKSEYRLH